MPRVVHFEFPVDDPERAKKFYEDVFGWRIEKWEGAQDYWLITTGEDSEPGINGAFARRSDGLQGTTNTIGVESLDESIAKAVENGAKMALPKTEVPGAGYVAYCIDTEGNVFGMFESTVPAAGQ